MIPKIFNAKKNSTAISSWAHAERNEPKPLSESFCIPGCSFDHFACPKSGREGLKSIMVRKLLLQPLWVGNAGAIELCVHHVGQFAAVLKI